MADKEPFSEKVTVAEKAEKVGNAGMYYALKNEKGLVFNVNEKVVAQCGGIRVGDTLFMEGVILPPKPGSTYTKGSRWVNSYTKDGSVFPAPAPPHRPVPVAMPPTPPTTYHPVYEGFRMGQAFNLGSQYVLATFPELTEAERFTQIYFEADKFLKASLEYEKNAGQHKPPIPF